MKHEELMDNISDMVKVAVNPAVLVGILPRLALSGFLSGFAASERGATDTSEYKAQESGDANRFRDKLRKGNPASYYLNPEASGPLGQLADIIRRRYYASKAEMPFLTSLAPPLGVLRGGEAGKHPRNAGVSPLDIGKLLLGGLGAYHLGKGALNLVRGKKKGRK